MDKLSHFIIANNIHFSNLLILVLVLVCYYFKCAAANGITIGSDDTTMMCVEEEREALLKFKQGITLDYCGLLSSWGDTQNCCEWSGVRCDNHTSRVTVLDLHGHEEDVEDDYHTGCLKGKVSSSLVDLKHLTYLDLSHNVFDYQPIPKFIGSLVKLKHLNLSNTGFEGEIPQHLGNLSGLISLDLSGDVSPYTSTMNMYVNDLSWLSRLTRLTTLNLSNANLSGVATNWLQIVNNLSFLRVLQLDYCHLPPPTSPQSLSYKNSTTTLSKLSLSGNSINESSIIFGWLFNLSGINTHLAHLDLSRSQLQGNIPSFIGNMQSLSYIDLSENQLKGPVPDTIANIKPLTHLDLSSNNLQLLPKTLGNLCSLQEFNIFSNNLTDELSNIIQSLSGCANKSLVFLDLGYNHIWGSVPDSVGDFSLLTQLYLSTNKLNGTISESLGQLSMLETLDLSSNLLKGTLSSIHFSELSKLKNLDLSNNTALTLNFSADWIPPFQLYSIDLSNIKLGPLFPKWIMTQVYYRRLHLSNTGISHNISDSFFSSMPFTMMNLDLSHNNLHGTLKDYYTWPTILFEIDLSFNNIEGAIPIFPSSVSSLLLNNNKFSSHIAFSCPKVRSGLSKIDLSNNLLYGELPDCWINFPKLLFLHLENNRFSSVIPSSIAYLKQLKVLHLNNNSIGGGMQRSFENLTSLVILDLGHNLLSGHIPKTIGNHFRSLVLLNLRDNKLDGVIPTSLCKMSSLQILDLSSNNITGTIPKCIGNFKAMQNGTDLLPQLGYRLVANLYITYDDDAMIMWKSEERSFEKSLGLIKQIDLSNNKLEGEIPVEISFLHGLVSLNLSRNNLSGGITQKIGELTALELLDLKSNHLTGKIPTSFAYLNFLGILNVSNNNLSGKIPDNPHVQSFDASSYMGNPKLCGLPLPKCSWDHSPNYTPAIDNNINHHDAKESDDFFLGLCISVVLGFIIGFWGVCGTLVLKRSWRLAFFRSFDGMRGRFCVGVFMIMARVRMRQ